MIKIFIFSNFMLNLKILNCDLLSVLRNDIHVGYLMAHERHLLEDFSNLNEGSDRFTWSTRRMWLHFCHQSHKFLTRFLFYLDDIFLPLCSLVQWLKHSKKEYCELCMHKFTFAPSKTFLPPTHICTSVLS